MTQGREREPKEDEQCFTQKNGKITPGREEIQLQNSEIQAPTNKQAKHSNANLQETLLLSEQPKPSKCKRERAKRIKRNEEGEAYL